MALSWLSLAREDQAVDDLLASWDAAKPVKAVRVTIEDRLGHTKPCSGLVAVSL
jgi:hypothetical protein